MIVSGCDIIGEIHYGSELPYEALDGVEAALKDAVEDLLAEFDPVYVDFRASGDALGFLSSLRECPGEEFKRVCAALVGLMDPQGAGRVVAVAGNFGAVRVWNFSAKGVQEAAVAPAGGRKRG